MDAVYITVACAVLAVALIYVLIQRQRAAYGKHVEQLKPKKRHVKSTEFKLYTREEVAKHCSRDDAWVIIKDKRTGVREGAIKGAWGRHESRSPAIARPRAWAQCLLAAKGGSPVAAVARGGLRHAWDVIRALS